MTYHVHYTGKFFKGLSRDMQSPSHSTKITYEVGNTYDADSFEVSDAACGPGIHIVTSIAAALKWGPVVVEVSVPDGAEVVCSEDKLRTSQITVISRANLREANLRGADLSGADLYEANLRRANLYEANLRRANLRGANLYEANLSGANLYEADLYGANLSGADLSEANLRGANLSGADLSGADLSRADLSRADLSRANLRGADLYRADLRGAYGEPKSLPDGWIYTNGLIVPDVEEIKS
jgi:hypothetical protein